jgi:spore coat polysaccharide biosynthesis protein SpsF (cytidylyltransferase family)
MKEKIGIIIQARMASTRLPEKVLAEISGKPILWHIVERCKDTKANQIIIATSINKENDKIEEFCKKNKISLFRGSEEDALNRYYEAAKKFELTKIIRITGDCPLISPEIINQIIDKFAKEKVDYLSNVSERSFPRGLDCEIFSFATLEKANNLAKEKSHREHVTAFIYGNPKMFKMGKLIAEGKLKNPNIRLCVDTKKDLELIKIIYSKLYSGKIIPINQVIDFLRKNSELIKMNQEEEIKQREQNKKEHINQSIK